MSPRRSLGKAFLFGKKGLGGQSFPCGLWTTCRRVMCGTHPRGSGGQLLTQQMQGSGKPVLSLFSFWVTSIYNITLLVFKSPNATDTAWHSFLSKEWGILEDFVNFQSFSAFLDNIPSSEGHKQNWRENEYSHGPVSDEHVVLGTIRWFSRCVSIIEQAYRTWDVWGWWWHHMAVLCRIPFVNIRIIL